MIANKCHRKFTNGVNSKLFYGITNSSYNGLFDDTSITILPPQLNPRFIKLLGPSISWNVFKKQQDVLDFVSKSNCDLFPFTYQINDGNRLFLAAHPITFWYIDEQREATQRHTYEIIQENRPCKLYFDLEFDTSVNSSHDGNKMVGILINFVSLALQSKYNISCRSENILNLDSSTPTKFSCHLIFQNVIFENNYHAGYFVKQLCYEIRSVSSLPDLYLLRNCNSKLEDTKELFILDSKGSTKLFCDEAVYTKNRHFRLYKSSKAGKGVSLKVSPHNLFQVSGADTAAREENIFLSSLITYCSKQERLKYDLDSPEEARVLRGVRKTSSHVPGVTCSSPFPEIDKCIGDIVEPGKIYRSIYFPENRTVVYDIVNNRYCGNIGRQHKSNNVKYVVEVGTLTYYQKCYDPDCADFKSLKVKLPIENICINHNTDDVQLLSVIKHCQVPETINYSNWYRHRNAISDSEDEDLVEAAEKCELMNRSRGKSLIFQDSDDELLLSVAESCEASMRSASDNYEDALPDTEDEYLMADVAEQCEMMRGKRKAAEYLADDQAATNVVSKHRKEMFEATENHLMIQVTETCELLMNLDEFCD